MQRLVIPKTGEPAPRQSAIIARLSGANVDRTGVFAGMSGSPVFIDGKQVVDNGGAHGMEEVSGNLDLTTGNHALKVEFFEKDIDAGCKLSWQSEKIEKQIVPAEVLFH